MRNGQNDHKTVKTVLFFSKINKNMQRKPWMTFFVHLRV